MYNLSKSPARLKRVGAKVAVAALLCVALVTAAFAFSTPLQAQDDSYVDLAVEIRIGSSLNFVASNQGTATAYGVTVDIEIADQTIHGIGDGQFEQKSGTTCSGNIPGTTCINGVWTVGTLEPGEETGFPITPRLASGLPCCTNVSTNWTVPARAVIKNSVPEEEDRFKGDNTAVGWIFVSQDGTGSEHADGRYWLEASVDDLLPETGDTVKFTFRASTISGSSVFVGDAKVRLKLDNGLGTPTATPPSGTTFAAATGLTRTWDWNIGTFTTFPLNLVVSTTLDDPLPTGVARSDLCLTAEMTARPDNSIQLVTSAEICLREDPVTLFQTEETDLFTLYPCVGETDYPCSSSDTLELLVNGDDAALAAGIRRHNSIMRPEKVVIQVPDPGGRVGAGSDLSWQTISDDGESYADPFCSDVEEGVLLGENWNSILALGVDTDDASTVWSNAKDQVTATGIGGGTKPGTLRIESITCDFEFANADTGQFSDPYGIGDEAVTVKVVYIFGELGTYLTERTYIATHRNGTPSDTTDDVDYTATGSYIFHVGPIAELEVRDGDGNPAVPADQQAFTIVAVNNGPDDAPAAQVAVTGLNASDYISHNATAGTFNSTTGVWTIGELRDDSGYYRATRHPLGWPTLTIITSAAEDTEITAAISNTQDYQVCIDSSGDDVDLSSPSESACTTEDSTNSWHTTPYYDYISDNSSNVTIKAKDGTGDDLPALQMAQEDTASIVMEWDPVGVLNQRLVTHYEVEWSADGATNWQQLSGNVSENRYVDTGVGPGDTRYYRVRAINDRDHNGPWSTPIRAMVEAPVSATAGAPDAPVLTAVPNEPNGRTEALITWAKPVENGSPITSYTLQVADRSSGPWTNVSPQPGAAAERYVYSDGLTGGTRKYFRMLATNMCDGNDPAVECDSPWSDVVDVTTRTPGISGAPTNVSAAPDGESAIDVSWAAPADDGGTPITRYEVQWSADGVSGWRNAGSTADGTTLTFKNTRMTFGTTRYYRVAARNSRGLSAWSDPPYASATTLAGVPGQPSLTARDTDANTIALTWTVPADNGDPITGYEIDWSEDGSANSWNPLTNPGASDTSHADSGLDPGTQRYYQIRARNNTGEGSWSTARNATTPPAVPAAPTLRAEPNGQNAIDVIWEPPFDDGGADISGYELHWSADGAENSYSRLTSPSGTARYYTHGNLQPGTTRHYQLRARNRAGWSEFSQSASATTLTGVPAAPGLTARANGASEIKLSWTKPDDRGSDILVYHLQQSDDGNDWYSQGGNIPASDTEYVHDGLSGGTTKHYRIQASNGNGDGQWSQVRNARTDAGGPDAPVLTLTVMGDNQIDLGWTVPADNGSSIRGYWVERSVDGNEPWERLTSNNRTTEYSDSTLYRGITRHYRVAAFNGAGTGPYSEAKSATTTGDPATAPGTPTLFRLSEVGRNQVTIAWDPPSDDGGAPVTGYEYEAAVPCEDDPNTPENESEYNCGFTGDDIRETTGTSARITGLSTDGDYFFQVRAVNIIGKGEWSRDIQATLRPSTSSQVQVSPTTITVNEGATVTYTIRLSTAPPHPVQAWIQPQGSGGYNDIEEAAFEYSQSLLVPNGWTHPDPDEAPYWTEFSYNWSQGVRVTFTAPEDADTEDEVAVMDHFVSPLPYDHYRPCRQEDLAERDQCKQDWEQAWAESPYQQLTGASVKVIVRDND